MGVAGYSMNSAEIMNRITRLGADGPCVVNSYFARAQAC
jgi:hypothetical protein